MLVLAESILPSTCATGWKTTSNPDRATQLAGCCSSSMRLLFSPLQTYLCWLWPNNYILTSSVHCTCVCTTSVHVPLHTLLTLDFMMRVLVRFGQSNEVLIFHSNQFMGSSLSLLSPSHLILTSTVPLARHQCLEALNWHEKWNKK